MNHSVLHGAGAHRLAPLLALLLAAAALPARAAPAFALASSPLFLQTLINPNVLVMFDNSQSMDATMVGKMIQGSDQNSRTYIARKVLREVITAHRYAINWGLGSFEISGKPSPMLTYAYYLGDSSTMLYTNTCNNIVDGVGVSDKIGTYTKVVGGMASEVTGNLPCVQNPPLDGTPTNGYRYITYARSSDDGDVNDVYYDIIPVKIQTAEKEVYGVGSIGSSYKAYNSRFATTGWTHDDFDRCSRTGNFKPCKETPFLATDAGFAPDASKYPRLIMARRAMGYDNAITGLGKLDEPVVLSQATTTAEVSGESSHNAKLLALLANEDMDPASANIKNAARRTPLAGALKTSREYFSNALTSPSPVTASCQKNFVVLATDGNPTGKKDGTAYDLAARTNTKDPVTGLWTFGLAVKDVLDEVKQLKGLPLSGAYGTNPNGVPTYVVGMGDGVANPSSVAALNEMATQGGTGGAFLANSPEALKAALGAIIDDIVKGDAAGSSVVLNSTSLQAGSRVYQPKFDGPTWTGELSAFNVNENAELVTTAWQAAAKITAQDWNTGRTVLTYKPSAGAGVAFRWPADPTAPKASEIDAAQAKLLDTNADGIADGLGSERLAYLRGNASREARNCTACTPNFRNRTTAVKSTVGNVLGDIVGSAPFYVGSPDSGYDNSLESVSYSAFVSSHASRKPYLYVGANDGMLHAIDAATGEEKFAYVPNLVFSKLSRHTATPYVHQYTVDGSPIVRDVFYAGAWHSLLVSGLRAGGKGLFALDVTNPSGVTEATAASVVQWEVSDADLGHVFAQPALVKTNDGKWSVIVGNGYNAGTPRAQLFVIDAETGAVTKLDTGAGSAASPNGLSGVSPVDVNGDGKADVVYAGDLDGNLWKFDLTATSAGSWSVAFGGKPLFAAGATKPITARPDVGLHPKGGFIVTFATGRYLAPGEVASIAPQTAYGIWDQAGSSATVTATQLQQQLIETDTVVSNGKTFRFSTHRVGVARDAQLANDLPTTPPATFYTDKRGWYFDLPTSGERVVADPTIRGGRAIFTSIIPTVSADCKPGGTSWIMEVDVVTGNRLSRATFDTDANKLLSDADFLKMPASASGKNNTTGISIEGLATAPAFMTYKKGVDTSEMKFVNTTLGRVERILESSGTAGERRVMWRVVQ